MSSPASQSLINLLLESGVPSRDEAAQLTSNLNGGSWVGQVLDSGKVDEQRFLGAIGNFCCVPLVSIDAKKIDRTTLSILPSRFVFQHHILPIEVKENSVVLATYDLFNSVGRQLASQLLKQPAEWVLVPRGQILRAMKTLYGVGAETFDEILKTSRAFEVLQDGETSTDLNADDPEASVVKFVNQIIREAILERATDIHVEPLGSCAFVIGSIEFYRDRSAAAVAPLAIGHHLPLESDVAHGYRRTPAAPGRAHEFAGNQSKYRCARLDDSYGQRRID
jgi:general secretion pathway protein E/type IV pilus assembly protein PilB